MTRVDSHRLLVVEDDDAIANSLTAALRTIGNVVQRAATGLDAIAQATPFHPELVLLDLGLPDRDGVDVCRDLRRMLPDVVIVVLTARLDESDVLVSLDAGADDYLTKPFRLAELMARIQAHLRRSSPRVRPALSSGNVVVDTSARKVLVDGGEVELRPREFDLLLELISQPGVAVTRDELMERVWETNWFGSTKTLDMHISSLRRRLESAGVDPEAIGTLRGHGYRWDLGESADPISRSTETC